MPLPKLLPERTPHATIRACNSASPKTSTAGTRKAHGLSCSLRAYRPQAAADTAASPRVRRRPASWRPYEANGEKPVALLPAPLLRHILPQSTPRRNNPTTAQHGPPFRAAALFPVRQHGWHHPRYGRKMVATPPGVKRQKNDKKNTKKYRFLIGR